MPKCPKDCKKHNPFIFRKVVIPAVVDDDTINPPANGAYCNAVVVYEATGNVYLYSSDGIPTSLSSTDYNLLSNLPSINGKVLRGDVALSDLGISQLVEEESRIRATADEILQRQIDAITVASDVVDIVGTYEELEEYDTSKLKENDIIKVLSDETIGGATAYYRWVNGAWQYIGEEGPYYTKTQTDALLDQKMDITSLDNYYTKTETDTLLAAKASVSDLANKQDTLIAGSNITIDPTTNVISATVPSLTNYYTKSETYSQTEVDNLINGVEADIPTKTSDLLNDSGFLTGIPIASSSVLGGVKVGSGLSIAQDGTLSADAQHIDIDSSLSTTSTNPVENRVITNALNNKANTSDIPTVPTNVSAFYNDAGYLTSTDVANNYYNKSETYTQAQVNALIPTKTSDLTNDGADGTSTYVEADDLGNYVTLSTNQNITGEKTFVGNKRIKFKGTASNSKLGFTTFDQNNGENGFFEVEGASTASKKVRLGCYDQNSGGNARDNYVGFQYYNTKPVGGGTVSYNLVCPPQYKGISGTNAYAYIPVDFTTNGVDKVSAGTSGVVDLSSIVPSKTSELINDSGFITGYTETDPIFSASAAAGITSADISAWNDKSDFSGSYNDLTDKPTIPTVNDATLTIQKNGTNVQTFTANQSTNATANITVPTKTSDLTNDSNFVSDASYVHTDNNYTTADKNKLAGIAAGAEVNVQSDWNVTDTTSDDYIKNKPTIGNATLTVQKNGTTLDTFTANATANKTINIPVPTKTSDLTNDSGYVVDDGDIVCADTDGGFAQITNPTSHNVAPTSLTHLYGNATQETLSGKNLFSFDNAILAQYPQSGLNIVRGANDITITAETTTGSQLQYAMFANSFDATKTYTISGKAKKIVKGTDGHPWLYVRWRGSNDGGTTWSQYTNTYEERNPTQGTEYSFSGQLTGFTTYQFLFYNNANAPASLGEKTTYYDIQLEAGSATPYEEYCGGVPMPNPQFPSPVETVTGAQMVKITGKNMFDGTYVNYAIGGTGGNMWFPSSTTRSAIILCQPSTTYTVKKYSGNRLNIADAPTMPSDNSTVNVLYSSNSAMEHTITTSATAHYLLVYVTNDSTEPEMQVELGTTATSYEPYQGQSQEINLGGTNLCPSEFEQGGISNTTGANNSDATVRTTNYATVKENTTYTASTNKGTNIAIRYYKSDGTYIGSGTTASASGNTFTTPALTARVRFVITNTTDTSQNFMLNKGSTALPYTPYTTYAYELAKIGTYQDYIWNDDGTWKIHKEVGKVDLGSLTWVSESEYGAGQFRANMTSAFVSDVPVVQREILCSHFTWQPSANYNTMLEGHMAVTNSQAVPILRTRSSVYSSMTASDFKTAMSGIYLYYPIYNTPTDTEITDSELIGQLNHIYSLYRGTNNLWLIPSAGAQGEMTLCASLSQLPVATTQRLGAVMVGDGLTIAENGELSISNETYNRFVPKDDLWKITYPLLPTKSKIEISGDSLYYISGDDGMQAGWGFKSASDFALNEGMRCTVRTNGPASSSDAHYNSDMGLAIHTSYGTYVTKPIYKKFPYGSWSPAPTLKYSDIPNATNAYTLLDLVYVKNSYYDGWVVTNL